MRIRQINFDGHEISGQGIWPLSVNIEDLQKMLPLADTKQLSSLIRTLSFYTCFVQHYAGIIEPLRQLLHQEVPRDWSADCQRTIEMII